MTEILATENDALTAQMAGAERTARLLIAGFRVCDEDGSPLSERQQCALLTAALLEFDGFREAVRGALTFDRLLARLADDGLS
jgi:hypothetical protein